MSKKSKPIELRLRRGEDGKVEHVEGTSPILAIPVVVRPMTFGDSRAYESFGEPLYSWTPEEKIKVINEHIVEPEIEIEDVDDLESNFDPWTIEDLVQAVFVYSGMQRLFEKPEAGNVEAGEEDQKPISA